ncbi:LapA family protein [Lentibacillus saliphilus]|uniref:LapA family protein n=1 Tax=Lentibacillus saliphilus TaxID=2737028 RepID=UPI001C3058B9
MKNQYTVILAIVVFMIVAIFAVINVEAVEINYLFGTGKAPLVLIILSSVLMGGILTASAGAVRLFRLQRENKKLKAKLRQFEFEVEDEGKASSSLEKTDSMSSNNHSAE